MRRATLLLMFLGLTFSAGCVTKVVEVPVAEPTPPTTASAETMRLRFSDETFTEFTNALSYVYLTDGKYEECRLRNVYRDSENLCASLYPAYKAQMDKMLTPGRNNWFFAQEVCVDFDAGMTFDEVLAKAGVPIRGQMSEAENATVRLITTAVSEICPEHMLAIKPG